MTASSIEHPLPCPQQAVGVSDDANASGVRTVVSSMYTYIKREPAHLSLPTVADAGTMPPTCLLHLHPFWTCDEAHQAH